MRRHLLLSSSAAHERRAGARTYHVERDLPAVGFRRGDRLICREDGSVTLTRALCVDTLATALGMAVTS